MSEMQRGNRGAKARPHRGFAHNGTTAAFPGYAIMTMALRREPRICALVDRNAIRINCSDLPQYTRIICCGGDD